MLEVANQSTILLKAWCRRCYRKRRRTWWSWTRMFAIDTPEPLTVIILIPLQGRFSTDLYIRSNHPDWIYSLLDSKSCNHECFSPHWIAVMSSGQIVPWTIYHSLNRDFTKWNPGIYWYFLLLPGWTISICSLVGSHLARQCNIMTKWKYQEKFNCIALPTDAV